MQQAAVVEPAATEEEPRLVSGPEGQQLPGKRLTLGIEKFRRPKKYYRLIWIHGGEAWLAGEDETPFRRASGAVIAGQALAEEYGARFREVTR